MNITDIKHKIIDDFKNDASEEFISDIIDRLITESLIKDCMFILTLDNPVYMDNIYRIIRIYINHQKGINEKKLAAARSVNSLLDDKDIFEKIMEISGLKV